MRVLQQPCPGLLTCLTDRTAVGWLVGSGGGGLGGACGRGWRSHNDIVVTEFSYLGDCAALLNPKPCLPPHPAPYPSPPALPPIVNLRPAHSGAQTHP